MNAQTSVMHGERGEHGDRWSFSRLLDAPHRLAFSAATLVLVISSLWWAVVNLSFSDGVALHWSLPPSLAHSLLMSFGFMPLFFAGFLFTAGPKWLARPAVAARELLPALMPQVAGWLVFMLAIHGRDAAFGQVLGALGLGTVTLGWSQITLRFWRMLKLSTVADQVHARCVAVACVIGVAAMAAAAAGVALGAHSIVRAAVQVGLWGFDGLVFAAVAHRMIPFLSSEAAWPALDAWRLLWLLWAFMGVFAFEAFAQAVESLGLAGGIAWHLLRSLVELPAGLGVIALAVRWAWVQSLTPRLVAMLHFAFAWLGIALLLFGVADAAAAAGLSPTALGLAPIHAYTMGYLGATMFAMVTRVSSGHGGRTVAADDVVWRLFWVLQLAIVSRVAAALVFRTDFTWGIALAAVAALGWAGVFVTWSMRHGRWYGMPRADGRPG